MMNPADLGALFIKGSLRAPRGGHMRQAPLATLASVVLLGISSALAQTTAPGAGPGAAPATGGGLGDWWWIILVVALVAAAAWYFTRNRRA